MTEFLTFATLHSNLAFTTAIAAMSLIGAIAALGIDFDADADFMPDLPLLDWANAGKLPLLAWLSLFAMIYGVGGLAAQSLIKHLLGAPMPLLAASLGAIIPAALVTRTAASLLAPFVPRDESSAITLDNLIGRRGRLETGVARQGHPARARFRDQHGQSHYLMVEPAANSEAITEGDEVLLISIEPALAIRVDHDPFHPNNPV